MITCFSEQVTEAGGGEALETGKVLEHLNMQLMSVDSAVEIKYMDILQEDDEEKRKVLEDGVSIMYNDICNLAIINIILAMILYLTQISFYLLAIRSERG